MSCTQSGPILDAYVDNELDPSRSLEIERHLESCAQCQARVRSLRDMRQRLASPEMRFAAPAALRARVLDIAQTQDSAPGPRNLREFPARERTRFSPALFAAAAALVIFSITGLLWLRSRDSERELTRDLVAAHVRSLMVADHLLDVPSSDQHTVKPWFHGKLDYAPKVADLATSGYPLAGGRLDYIGGRPVAVLVFQRRQHPINVFEWPTTTADVRPHNRIAAGYNLVHWNENGMEYWAVSDLNYNELAAFVELLRKA